MLLFRNISRISSDLLLNSLNKTLTSTVQPLRNITRIPSQPFRNISRVPSHLLLNTTYKTRTSIVQSCALNSYFSVTREKLGRSQAEIKKELTIPDPPAMKIYHCRRDVKMNQKKMIYAANLVRGMPIEEAIVQSEFSPKGASEVVKEVLEEAQKKAVEIYGFEDKSLLYVDASFTGRGRNKQRIKFHGRGRFGMMKKYYCHYFVILKEGVPPGKNIKRTRKRYLPDLEKRLRHPKTIKNSLAWW